MRKLMLSFLLCACGSGSPGAARPAAPAAPPSTPASRPAEAPAAASPRRAQEAYAEGYARAMDGDFDAALVLFRRATELDPHHALAWFDLAGLLEQTGHAPEALEAMRRAVDAEPRFVQARAELSSLMTSVNDDSDGALAELRAAVTTRDPFTVDRYPIARSRGEALHKVGAQFGALGFIAAAAAVEESLLDDPTAEPHQASARVLAMASRTLAEEQEPAPGNRAALARLVAASRGTGKAAAAATLRELPTGGPRADDAPAIDRFTAWRAVARLEETAGDLDRAAAALAAAAAAARQLPLASWLDTTVDRIALAVRRGDLDGAAALFDELAWVEAVTAHAASPVGGRGRSRRLLTATGLDALRAHPRVVASITELGLAR